jgi:3-deoxy-7-phosphoheptulonate synthase
MIIQMIRSASEQEILAVVLQVESLGFQAQVDHGLERTVVAVVGVNVGQCSTDSFETMLGVERVVRISKPFKLPSREFKPSKTVVEIGSVQIGGGELVVMAGPCSVENEKQIMTSAEFALSCGAKVLRGGAFKPRTSPYAFQGLGLEGLKLLEKARKATGLLVVTEVLSPEKVGMVADHADILQIGARNMQNYDLLKAVGKAKKPVLLKRHYAANLSELLMAADYILQESGTCNVVLCLRGIRTFESESKEATRFTCDFGSTPVLGALTHLPIIADPSHVAGNYRLVPTLANMAVVSGCDGLIVEMHPNPAEAVSDGAQSLSLGNFAVMMQGIKAVAESVGKRI